MSAEAFGRYLPAVVTLDDLAAMNAAEMIERDSAQAVTLHQLGSDKTYEVGAKMPLTWLLQTKPADHHLDG